jgi:hypothetical protein
VSYEVGDSFKVLFWHDVWYGEQPLKVLCPELFTNVYGNDAWVAENMQIHHGNIHWRLGVLYLLDSYTIGRWKWSLGSLSCCILKE